MKKKTSAAVETVSKSEFAAMVGVSRSMVTKLCAKGLPVKRDGRIDPVAAEAWLAAYRAPKAEKPSETLAEAILRKERALASLREIELAIKAGEAIAIDDFDKAMQSMIFVARSRLLAIPAAVAQELAAETDPHGCEQIVRREIYDALSGLSAAEVHLPDGGSGDENAG